MTLHGILYQFIVSLSFAHYRIYLLLVKTIRDKMFYPQHATQQNDNEKSKQMPKKKRVSDSESDSEDDRKQRKRLKKEEDDEEEVEFEIEDLKKFTPRKRLRKKRNFSEDEEDSSEENDSDYYSERELRCNETRGEEYNEKESFVDAITLDRLQERHIDWLSPDVRIFQIVHIHSNLQ